MIRNGTADKNIDQAVNILRDGGLIAFPTETYYGLAVDPFNESALKKLFTIKNRPAIKPVLVLIPARNHIMQLADAVPDAANELMNGFWPGPLTIVLSARQELSQMLTGGTGTIGVRMSPHPVAQVLLKAFAGPLTATSANRSGGSAAVTADEVLDIFGKDVDMVLDGGQTPGGSPSTLVGFSGDIIDCIREGCISCSDIKDFLQQNDQ